MRPWVRSGDFLVAAMVLTPLAIAWPRIAMTASGTAGWLNLAQRVCGVLALSTFLASAVLSVRIPKIDRFFGGLTRLWQAHHMLGLACFLLVMAHALLVGLVALPTSPRGAVPAMFPPFSVLSVWLGWLAFLGLLIFLAPSFKFFGEPHYQNWKRLHLVSAAALVFGLAHALTLASETLVWWMLGALAVLAVLWRKVFSRFLACRPYVVTEARSLAAGVVELSLRSEGPPLRYDTGQFFYLTPYDSALAAGYGEEHPYTASSAPAEEVLRIGIKALGDATRAILRIQPGSRVRVEGPYGLFFERRCPERDQLWVGGGIGITPFVAATRAMHLAGPAKRGSIHLLYLADSRERAYYLDELCVVKEGFTDFNMTPHYFKNDGPISMEFVEKHCPDFREREIYLCGPSAMTAHLKKLLRDRDVPRARIHTEDFTLL